MPGEFHEFLSRYLERVGPLMKEANQSYWQAATTGRAEDAEQAAAKTAELRKLHSDPDEFSWLKRQRESGAVSDPLDARQLDLILLAFAGNQLPADKIELITGREQEIESEFANHRPSYQGRSVSDNDLLEVLAEEKDENKRRTAWEASKQIGAKVAPLLLSLVEERNQAARELGYADFYQMKLELDELDEKELFEVLDELERLTAGPFARAKEELDTELARRFKTVPGALRPWHYADPFFQEAPPADEIDLDRFFDHRDPVELARSFYAGLGLPVDDVISRSDLYERPGKNQHAFCMDADRRGDVRVLANVRPNAKWTDTLLHELGHAVYSKYHDPSLPFLLRDAAHICTTEAVAMMMGRLTRNAGWLHRQAGVGRGEAEEAAGALGRQLRLGELIFVRWGLVMVRFERALYRGNERDLNGLWWRLVRELQLLTPPEDRNEPDWASKIHLGTVPVYYHNYLLGALAASQIWAAVTAAAGDAGAGLVGSQEAGRFLRERIFAPGARYRWNEMLRRATGERLTARYFAREFVER